MKAAVFSLAFSLALAMVVMCAGRPAVAQTTNESNTSSEQTTVITETKPAPTPPNPLFEKTDQITANKNMVVEDKPIDSADHDYMPLPSQNPERRLIIEEDSGGKLGEPAPPSLVLVTEEPNSVTPSTTKGPFYDVSENEMRARKFFRGAGNVLLCVGEVPNQMFQEAYRTSPITGVVVGAGKGLWKGAKRLMIGTWEMVTFFHPGKTNYQPYIQPEVVFEEYLH